MPISLEQIVEQLRLKNIDFHFCGPIKSVNGMAAVASDVENSLCYYVGDDPAQLSGIRYSIVVCKPQLKTKLKKDQNTYIFTSHPQLAFYQISLLFDKKPKTGIHESAIVDPRTRMGENVSIGAFCVIEKCILGNDVVVESGVRIQEGTLIGNHVHIQSGTVIGATGFMWVWDENEQMVPCVQTGYVIVEDRVSIGSNISIVRGAFPNKPTIIGEGSVIAHGTMIGHGVVVGAKNHFANNVAIAGSVSTGENCFFGSGVVVRPHVSIAPNTVIGAGAVVVKNILEKGQVWVGNPARLMVAPKDTLSGVPASYSN